MDSKWFTKNINALWARAIAQELERSDVRHVCLTPGSRNTPLTVALTRINDLKVISHLDERSSSFFGLGLAKRTARPVVLVSTSGTAAAEFHPAVLEAYHAGVPLLVMTADRPPELQQSGANQTVEQQNLYGSAVRWFRQLSEPEPRQRKLRSLRSQVDRAVHRTREPDPGPVHLNVPFRKPLEPSPEDQESVSNLVRHHPLAANGREDQPFVTLKSAERSPERTDLDPLVELFSEAERPLLYAGPLLLPANRTLTSVRQFAVERHLPLLADPLSGQRFEHDDLSPAVEYETVLPKLPSHGLPEPDLILRLGDPPNASNVLMDFLKGTSATQAIVSERRQWPEAEYRSQYWIRAPVNRTFSRLNDRLPSDRKWGDWNRRWLNLDRSLFSRRRVAMEEIDTLFEPSLLKSMLDLSPDGTFFFLGNSSPVRDCIQFSGTFSKNLTLTGNRGASGIDGQVSTLAGLGFDGDQPVVGVIGDIGFYHDMNGLLGFERHDINAILVVINNDGGGVFNRLPIRNFDPPFNDYVKTPHGLTFEDLARQFNSHYQRINDLESFRKAFAESLEQPAGLSIIEAITHGEKNQQLREELLANLRSDETFRGIVSREREAEG